MIYFYDIVKDKQKKCPKLIMLKKLDMVVDVSNQFNLVRFMNGVLHLKQFDGEHVYLILTNMYNKITAVFLMGIGDYKGCKIFTKNIATAILLSGGRKFLLAHNHPDGALELSDDDVMIVNLLKGISVLLETEFINSYVITEDGFITDSMTDPIYYDEEED